MSGDEKKSLQQNLPLSWEEDSQNNIEEQLPPKKLLLRKEEVSDEPEKPLLLKHAVDVSEESEPVPAPPKPLLLKKPQTEDEMDEEEHRKELDRLDTIYDKEIPSENDSGTYADSDDYSLEEEWDEESELEEDEDQFEESGELDDDEDIDEDNDLEEDEEDEESSDTDYEFQDSGTFTLDKESSDSENDSGTYPYEEDELEEDRIGIPDVDLDEVDPDDDEEDEESEESAQPLDEESVFALKADTYYEVQHSDGEDSTEETAEPSVVVQDVQVQSLGALLQEARLACSFTIKDAAESTRIKSSYIIALENNEMDELPAKVYVLNYIRQLCREYNVPNEPMIKAFENQSENNGNGHDVKIMRVGDEDARKATKPNSKLNALLVGTSLLVLLMLFLIGWYMEWINPTSSNGNIKVDVKLEEIRPEVKLPSPELPIPTR